MNLNELSKEEQKVVFKMRLDKLNLDIKSGCCKITGTVLTKDENKVALAIEDEYANKQILITLSDNQLNDIYRFIQSRHNLCKNFKEIDNEPIPAKKAMPSRNNYDKPF